MTERMMGICECCGASFWAERRTRRFCSDTCRVKNQRHKQQGKQSVAKAPSPRDIAKLLIGNEPALRSALIAFRGKHGDSALNDLVDILALAQKAQLPRVLRERLG